MAESVPVLPGLSPVAGKPRHAAFDGGEVGPRAELARLIAAAAIIMLLLLIGWTLGRLTPSPEAPATG